MRMQPTAMSIQNVVRACAMKIVGKHSLCQVCLIDNAKSRMLEWGGEDRMADGV
jgi:hypothetical protein